MKACWDWELKVCTFVCVCVSDLSKQYSLLCSLTLTAGSPTSRACPSLVCERLCGLWHRGACKGVCAGHLSVCILFLRTHTENVILSDGFEKKTRSCNLVNHNTFLIQWQFIRHLIVNVYSLLLCIYSFKGGYFWGLSQIVFLFSILSKMPLKCFFFHLMNLQHVKEYWFHLRWCNKLPSVSTV